MRGVTCWLGGVKGEEAVVVKESSGSHSRHATCSHPRLPAPTLPGSPPRFPALPPPHPNCSQGGLAPDLAVELANGSMAVVVEATPEYVRLDANSMMSGKTLLFELEVLGIDRPPAGPA